MKDEGEIGRIFSENETRMEIRGIPVRHISILATFLNNLWDI